VYFGAIFARELLRDQGESNALGFACYCGWK